MTGKRLKELRDRMALSQVALAKEIGVAPNTIARWERGELNMRPAMDKLIRLVCKNTDLTTKPVTKKRRK